MNSFVIRLTGIYYVVKFLGRHVQVFFGIISGHHYSLVNVSDDDFSMHRTADDIFNEKKDWNNADIADLFHIYLSKISYESNDQIEGQCLDWGFKQGSIKPLASSQSDLTKYPYSTAATVIGHDQSKTIIIAFRGTEPTDLVQWLTDASTNYAVIDYVFNDMNNDNGPIRVHAGFHAALGLDKMNLSVPIDFDKVTSTSPIFLQLLKSIEDFHRKHQQYQISVTGHSLGGGLASLFSFVLLAYGYESSISGVYTYGQPLVGNLQYAQILNKKLGNRIHRWVNHDDIVTRVPVVELRSIASYYDQTRRSVNHDDIATRVPVVEFPSIEYYCGRTPYSDALEVAGNNNQKKCSQHHDPYYHSGLRFRIDHQGNLLQHNAFDQGPIRPFDDKIDLFHLIYSIGKAIYSLLNITPLRSLLWLTMPAEINDHFPGDYARNIKKILKGKK